MDSLGQDEIEKYSPEIDSVGKVFAPGVGPYKEPVHIEEKPVPQPVNTYTQKAEERTRVPEYLSQENAKNLFEKGISEGEALTPLAFMYYMSQDKQDRKDPQNIDIRGALGEQKIINELFLSRQELSSSEWENVFQSPSGWKEIRHAVENSTGNQKFYEKTIKYLTIKAITAQLNNESRLSRSLYKTIALLRNNFKPDSNGA